MLALAAVQLLADELDRPVLDFSVFSRHIGTCVHDDVLPNGPKGQAAILFYYNDVLTFTEHGTMRYTIRDVDFSEKIENADKTKGEPKFYHFIPGESWSREKDEVYTYRSQKRMMMVTREDLEQMFRTVCYGIKWETFMLQVDDLRDAILRETAMVQYYNVREMFIEWLDAMTGDIKQDQWNYSQRYEDEVDGDSDDGTPAI